MNTLLPTRQQAVKPFCYQSGQRLKMLGFLHSGMVTKIGGKRRQHLYITQWREGKGLSVEKVADRVGVSRESVWRWENQQHRLNPGKIKALADAIGCNPEDFWRLPARPSLDAMVKDLDDDTYELTVDLVRRAARKKAV